ncbi:hypothetical protein KIH39_16650 [Telmatocola sphagniphila]|uniref:Uncharacterized protein n=1 Tax=Telmatocola sphagniphila TaxID=1123043 RepID=A0A8E6B2Z9_9BACT|nr:hypothetical protein [Telmatocola sphagniphila]QVL30479.1 hypothetical protein KIH39_16650 [Telmatocola sphagniphila]
MADRATKLILDALTRASTEPDGMPLFSSKSEEGLFPSTAVAKTTAERCREDGLFTFQTSSGNREVATLSEKGLQYLLHHSNPRQVLEDFVRILEQRQREVDSISNHLLGLKKTIEGMHSTLRELKVRFSTPSSGTNGHVAKLLEKSDDAVETQQILLKNLQAWRNENAAQDIPLPKLYQQTMSEPDKLGAFHDALRKLHEQGKIALHPWTGPLYALPEPAFALLIGHEIAYYANVI